MTRRIIVILAVGILLFVAAGWELREKLPTSADEMPPHPHILIDAGHGGEDGGTQAQNGTLEKTINLAIAVPLADFLHLCGCEVRLTRAEDTALYEPSARTVREKKVSDLKARLALYEQAKLVVSIHQNHFSGTQYYGAQVFYSSNAPASKSLAAFVREQVCAALQPHNQRELKEGGKSIYLLHKTTVPAILVECGFLSNVEERKKLETPTYQQQMALAIGMGVLHYGV